MTLRQSVDDLLCYYKTTPVCCVGLTDIWPDLSWYLDHIIPKHGYSLSTIVGAVLAALLTLTVISGLIYLTSLINPVGPACTCPDLDQGIVAWRAFPTEPIGPTTPNIWFFLAPHAAQTAPTTVFSTTSNSTKFNVNGIAPPIVPGYIIYHAVLVGTQIKLSGTVSISFLCGNNDSPVVNETEIQMRIGWSNNGVTFTILAEGMERIGNPSPRSGSMTFSFVLTLTSANINLGEILIAPQVLLTGAATPFYAITGLTILVDEI